MKYIILEKSDNKVIEKIIKLFKENPNPPDKKIHALAEKLKIEPDRFETIIYALLSDVLNHPTNKPDSKYDLNQLKMGTKVESEHTKYPLIAKEIAKDHLDEIPDYYTRLKKMESEAKHEE